MTTQETIIYAAFAVAFGLALLLIDIYEHGATKREERREARNPMPLLQGPPEGWEQTGAETERKAREAYLTEQTRRRLNRQTAKRAPR